MKLVELSDLKNYIRPNIDASHDTILTSILDGYSDRIESYLNRKAEKVQRVEKYDAGRRLYFVPAIPIDTGQTLDVKLRSVLQTINVDYWIDAEIGMIEFFTEPLYTEPQEIEITYTGGWGVLGGTGSEVVQGVPNAVKQAVMMQCKHIFLQRDELGVSAISMPDGSMNLMEATDLLKEVKFLLQPFKRQVYRR